MTMPNREGRFRACVTDRSVTETGPNKLATFVARYCILEELVDGEWQDISSDDLSIDGYHYIEKKDGTLNSFAIDALKAAFGWDGRDPYWLEDNDLPNCQVTLAFEEFNGRERLRVQWLNPYDSEGGMVQKAAPDVRKRLAAKLGPKLRSIAGGSPVATPTPAGAPKSSPKRSPKRTAPPKKRAPSATEAEAWAAFLEAQKASKTPITDECLTSEWFRIIAELTGKDAPGAVLGGEWYKIMTEGPAQIVPF